MRPLLPACLLFALVPAATCLADVPAAGSLRRLALVVGSNRGAADRVPLRYAVSDADRFADLVTRMGGVALADRVVLRDPGRKGLLDALSAIAVRAGEARAAAARVEAIVYFSGHADDQGLMLGRETVRYTELRQAIQAIGADVGITILDACASGAITRLKGGQVRPAFLGDVSSEVKGYAFLTSSSEDEAAQESERLRGSFFTHALLTGLRGAADVTGDGKVTLNEAYQFAFNETLVQTTPTQAGAQHPAYDIKMAGTGDVVMTDVRENSASMIMGEEYEGRFVVVSGKGLLVAELFKPSGRKVELGLEPGKYDVYFVEGQQLSKSTLALVDSQRQELTRGSFQPTERLPTRLRGSERLDLRLPRFGVRLGARGLDDVLLNGRLELVYRPDDRFAIRPRVGIGWRSDNVDYTLGLTVAYHFRPGHSWRPYFSLGAAYEKRSVPEPYWTLDENHQPVRRDYPPETGQDLWWLSAGIGMERRLSRHWAFHVELSSERAEPAEGPSNGYYGSGRSYALGLGLSFNLGGRGEPKEKR